MEFKEYRLKDIGKVVTGCTPSTNNKRYYESPIFMFVGPADMKRGKYIGNTEKKISNYAYQKYAKRFIPENSIIVDCIGSDMGNVSIISQLCLTNQQINAICNIDEKKFDCDFVYYVLSTMKKYFHSIGNNGSTMPIINKTLFEQIKIEIPSLENQKKIAKILSNIDKKIELNRKINNNLLEIGKSLFNNWLCNCDDELFISDIADEILDYTKNKNEFIKILNSSDITESIFPNVEFIENKDLKGHFKKRFKKYDILYSQIRPRNRHYGYSLVDDTDNYVVSTRFMVVRNKKEMVSSSLLYFYLTSDDAINDFTSKTESRSGTFPQGNYQDLSSLKIKYSHNQQEITKSLDVILKKTYENNLENENLAKLRDTLLPKLMNGEIDLDKIEI